MASVLTNDVHTVVLAYIRSHATSDIAETIKHWTDEQMLRQMFSNYREGRGLRLTRIGHSLMAANFKYYHFTLEQTLEPSHLLFLDARAKMPYYCNSVEIAIYDPRFAVRLRLVDCNVKTLIEIDTPD